MKWDPKDIELIERYLDNELPDGEKREFEKRLHEDPSLKALFDFRVKVHGLWNSANRYEQTRKEVVRAITTKGSMKVLYMTRTTFAIAASIVLLAAVTIVVMLIVRKAPSAQEQQLTLHEDSVTVIGTEKPEHKARQEIYKSGSIELLFPEDGRVFKSDE
ncbi:MAG: hypothetical protein ABIK52_07640, partial [Bacteroidota bacterium]